MSIHWEKILSDPLGLSGYALFLVFGVVTYVIKQRKPANRWVVPSGFILAALCIIGGITIAYRREQKPSPTQPGPAPASASTQPATPPSMHIDKVEQKVSGGNAVAGVQGNVTIQSGAPAQSAKPKQ